MAAAIGEVVRERVADAEAGMPRRDAARQKHWLVRVHPLDRRERNPRHVRRWNGWWWRRRRGREMLAMQIRQAGERQVLEPAVQQKAEALAVQRTHSHCAHAAVVRVQVQCREQSEQQPCVPAKRMLWSDYWSKFQKKIFSLYVVRSFTSRQGKQYRLLVAKNGMINRFETRAARFTSVSWEASFADTSARLSRRAWCAWSAARVAPPATPTRERATWARDIHSWDSSEFQLIQFVISANDLNTTYW